MLVIVGEVRSIIDRRREPASGAAWVQTTLEILPAKGRSQYVALAKNFVRDFGVPDEGSQVALEVSVDPYVRRELDPEGNPKAAFSFTGWRPAQVQLLEDTTATRKAS